MLDIDLLVEQLRQRGHEVGHVIPTPSNAGEYEFQIDGELLTLDQVRLVLEEDLNREEAREPATHVIA
jgi:hypothetical protein